MKNIAQKFYLDLFLICSGYVYTDMFVLKSSNVYLYLNTRQLNNIILNECLFSDWQCVSPVNEVCLPS